MNRVWRWFTSWLVRHGIGAPLTSRNGALSTAKRAARRTAEQHMTLTQQETRIDQLWQEYLELRTRLAARDLTESDPDR